MNHDFSIFIRTIVLLDILLHFYWAIKYFSPTTCFSEATNEYENVTIFVLNTFVQSLYVHHSDVPMGIRNTLLCYNYITMISFTENLGFVAGIRQYQVSHHSFKYISKKHEICLVFFVRYVYFTFPELISDT